MTRNRLTTAIVVAIVAAPVSAAVVALLINIFQRQQQARNPFYRVVELNDDTEDPAIWGKNFPFQSRRRTRWGSTPTRRPCACSRSRSRETRQGQVSLRGSP